MKQTRMTMTVQEVADYLGVSKPTAYSLTSQDDFPCLRIGKRILIPVAAFHDWLDRNTTGTQRTG